MSADVGKAEQYGSSRWKLSYGLKLKSIPTNAQTMNFTWVVQKTRSVSFLVKPPKSD